jgi:hypothetical protein
MLRVLALGALFIFSTLLCYFIYTEYVRCGARNIIDKLEVSFIIHIHIYIKLYIYFEKCINVFLETLISVYTYIYIYIYLCIFFQYGDQPYPNTYLYLLKGSFTCIRQISTSNFIRNY